MRFIFFGLLSLALVASLVNGFFFGREGGGYRPAYEGGGWYRPAREGGWYRPGVNIIKPFFFVTKARAK